MGEFVRTHLQDDRANEPEDDHEAADEADVPMPLPLNRFAIDVVADDRHAWDVGQEIVEQDLLGK